MSMIVTAMPITISAPGSAEHEIVAKVTIRHTRGQPEYFDKAHGNWLPADAEENELEELAIYGANEKLEPAPVWLFDILAADQDFLAEVVAEAGEFADMALAMLVSG